MTPIKAIIFDKDGTLHDTEKVYLEAWTLAAHELNVPDIENTVRDCTGTTIPWIAQYWAGKYPNIPFEDYLPRRQYHYFRILEAGVSWRSRRKARSVCAPSAPSPCPPRHSWPS